MNSPLWILIEHQGCCVLCLHTDSRTNIVGTTWSDFNENSINKAVSYIMELIIWKKWFQRCRGGKKPWSETDSIWYAVCISKMYLRTSPHTFFFFFLQAKTCCWNLIAKQAAYSIAVWIEMFQFGARAGGAKRNVIMKSKVNYTTTIHGFAPFYDGNISV